MGQKMELVATARVQRRADQQPVHMRSQGGCPVLVVLLPAPLLIPGAMDCCCEGWTKEKDGSGRRRGVWWRLQRKEPG